MTETTCAKCNNESESQWRIRLEHESADTSEETPYRLCRGCWNDFRARFDRIQDDD
jgi:DNA-directed RNA polymerase subunit M/transcription elongation factor TFIIS